MTANFFAVFFMLWQVLKSRVNTHLIAMLFLGFSSGLPLALTGSTLQAWYTECGINLLTIGALTLVGVPYIWKFLWSPVMDRFIPPFLGRRRGWIAMTQVGLCITLFIVAHLNPDQSPGLIGLLALLIAFISASQDIGIDAYRTDVLLPDERGLGSASFVFAYRMAMLVSGGVALIFADYFGWQLMYEGMAVLMLLSSIATYFSPESSQSVKPPTDFVGAIVDPLKDFMKRDNIGLILLAIVFYKLGDSLSLSLMSNFLLHGMGFSLTEVGIAFKTMGLFATLLGAFGGGILLRKLDLYRALIYFGIAQACSNLMFMMLAYVGKNHTFMFTAIFTESFFSGMSSTALVAFLMSLCNQSYSATQYAILSALSAVGRVLLGPFAAMIVIKVGWISFYFWSFILCIPGIIMINLLSHRKFNEELAKS